MINVICEPHKLGHQITYAESIKLAEKKGGRLPTLLEMIAQFNEPHFTGDHWVAIANPSSGFPDGKDWM